MSFKIISLHSIQATFNNRVILIFLNYSYQIFQEETCYYWIPKAACSALQKYIFFITGRGRGKVKKGWKETNKYSVNSFIESYLYFGKPIYYDPQVFFLEKLWWWWWYWKDIDILRYLVILTLILPCPST